MSRMSDTAAQQKPSQGAGEQFRDTAQQVSQNIREMGSQVRDAASDKYNQLRDQASQYYEEGRQRAAEWERSLEEYVQEKPIQSLLIAAGVGMLLGMFWKRR
jgi:ElaB/YqjD/DUF883 family membrane-anchored ribosome-binding protein